MSNDDRLILKVLGILNEAQARLYVAKEAVCKGRGGVQRMHQLTGLSRPTILKGISELRQQEPADPAEGIQDNGPGFEPEVRAQIFERRVKWRNSTGHGLGLAFVEAVVRVHGGTVEASNRHEGGARLTITLPLAVHSSSVLSPVMAHASD